MAGFPVAGLERGEIDHGWSPARPTLTSSTTWSRKRWNRTRIRAVLPCNPLMVEQCHRRAPRSLVQKYGDQGARANAGGNATNSRKSPTTKPLA